MTTAFYLDNSRIEINCSNIQDGNPGIGGTEYLFLRTTMGLQSINKNSKTKFILLLKQDMSLPLDMEYEVVGSKMDAVSYCDRHGIGQLVVKFENNDYSPNIFKQGSLSVKIIIWAHNIIPRHILNIIARTKQIAKIVNVGREQLDLYRDNKAFQKSTFIYNGVDVKPKEYYIKNSVPFSERKQEVTYLGSLVPSKGFHVLAKAWPEILRSCPEAHLNVIGNGTVYGNAKLGKHGIAEENYENSFMQYLTDSSGNIIPSVTFWGKLGKEKEDILARTKVGVPNPSGFTETFCLSAVEMELFGARIVTKKYVGYLDTVPNFAGQLVEKEECLANAIVEELQCNSYGNFDQLYAYIKESFGINSVVNCWLNFFQNSLRNIPGGISNIVNIDYNYKYLREKNRVVKSKIPFGYLFPTVDSYIRVLNRFVRIKIPVLY